MKKLFIAFFLTVCFTNVAVADERTDHEMIMAAKQVLNGKGEQKKAGANAEPKILRRSQQLSIVGYEDGRCAFISNDDSFEPVLGYTDHAVTESLPPALEWWIETMNRSLANYLAKGNAPQRLMSVENIRMNAAAKYADEVAPLLTTKWDQETPYNNLCPQYIVNNIKYRYVTGCVATAMAQVMNYYQYPAKGTGSRSFYLYDESGKRTRVYANFGNTTYDWENMLDVYGKNATYTNEQATAVATIMYHCGVAVDMNYAPDGSGAMCNASGTALIKYFNYHSDIMTHYREITHSAQWMDMIYRELNDGCPIIYGGASNQGGHAFVFDGYNKDGKVHVNWGWSGSGDGYFDVAKLNGYANGQEMTIVRKPDDTRYTDKLSSIWGVVEGITAKVIINKLSITAKGLFNFTNHGNFNGYLGIMAMDSITNDTRLLSQSEKLTGIQYGAGTMQFVMNATLNNIADGVYRIYLASKDDTDTEWVPVRSKEDVCNSYILTVKNGGFSLKEEKSSQWIFDLITGIDEIDFSNVTSADNTIRVFDISGKQIYSSPSNTFNKENIPGNGIMIIREGDRVRKIAK